ncbi:MAG: immune inhibitor A, partial [Ignavibacteriales bacterium]|nr:immune inhibitor A [Ignavibacteriales bacterium]
MKSVLTSLVFTLLFLTLSFSQQEKFSRVKIFVPDKQTLNTIWSTGIDYEGVSGKLGGAMEFVVSPYELLQLQQQGIAYEIVVDDLAKLYASRLSSEPVNALGFGYGSMGGFYTFAEVIKQLDTMNLLYPNLITPRDSIGRSTEGRALWAVKISDNPDQDEWWEPEVLYTALHHAREPEGMMAIVYYMWWLLENYGENPQATYLVKNRQMYFIPVVNPDGYVYNQTTDPDGGGMWRKNRRINGDGTFGVDPNRNYGPMYMWNANNGGSSTTTSSETYRGTAPFSEPENLAIDNFMRLHNIKACLNYHTYGNYLIYPFGYLSKENSDSLIYRDFAYDMTSYNNYTNGTDQQTVNYSTRGNSDDYMFGDSTKPRTFAMTPEVGTTGFWPTTPEIFPLAIENLGSNRYLSYVAGQTTRMREYSVLDQNANTYLTRGEQFSLNIKMRNVGLSNALAVMVTLSPIPGIEFSPSSRNVSALAKLSDTLLTFSGVIAPDAEEGKPFTLLVTTTDADGYFWRDSIRLVVGTPTVLFSDNGSSGMGNWTTTGSWGLSTTSYHTPPASFHDSPTGTYPSNANIALTKTTPLSFQLFDYVELQYWTKWALEPTWDFATVEVSTNNGSSWATVRSSLMKKASDRSGSVQPAGTFGYDSYTPGLTFVRQFVDLTPYKNFSVKLRFRTAADGGEQRDGFYVDDIRVLGYVHNILDTTVAITPAEFTFTRIPGREFSEQIRLLNNTSGTVDISVAETSLTAHKTPFESVSSFSSPRNFSLRKSVSELLPQVLRNPSLHSNLSIPSPAKAEWTTLITDAQGENLFAAVDIHQVEYQKRNFPPPIGPVIDFRLTLRAPTTKVIGVLSVDVDQEFTTGAFPPPFGAGVPLHDVGSEFEVICVLNGQLAESLGIGNIPIVVVISNATDSLVGIPLPITVNEDSVMSATFTLPESYFDDAVNMNLSALFANYEGNVIPDNAPNAGHGTIGVEKDISWLALDTNSLTLESGDTATVNLRALSAKLPGTYQAQLRFSLSGQPAQVLPVQLHVTAPPPPHGNVSPLSLRDTVVNEDSSTTYITVSNTGGGLLLYALMDTAGVPWLKI